MTAPTNEVVQMEYKNPDASMSLFVPVRVIANTPDEDLERNIRINSAKDLTWLKSAEAHDGIAILVGGGPSLKDKIEDIREYQLHGGTVFAMNAASQYLREHGIVVDYQCIIDAKEETAELVDNLAIDHLFGSQVDPKTMDSVASPIVWHLDIGDIEQYFPEDRVKKGGYALLGGGVAVGNSALCVAYVLGYRDLQIFGYDSSNRENESHAYDQPMNRFIPNVEVEWAGKKFTSSVAMKAQAEKFQLTANALKEHDCDLTVHGDGLLPTMYNTSYHDLSEKEKYQLMWQFDAYRNVSPGEHIADFYLNKFKPEGTIIDFGCGTGRAGIKFNAHGINTLLVDFTDNCRDREAATIPFLQWDLTNKLPVDALNGFCTDVMEHIPTNDVSTVILNIMNSADKVFFQISTIDDVMGAAINEPLHLTVKPYEWWRSKFISSGYHIEWADEQESAVLFYVTNPDRRKTCQ
jgi:hypothetical protein